MAEAGAVEQAGRWIPHYERSLADAPRIRRLEDLRGLPITRREDLEADPVSFVSRAPGLTASVAMGTSGTTGRRIPLWLSPGEFDYYCSVQALAGLFGGFLGPSRILQVSVPLENSITARLLIDAAQQTGTLVLVPGLLATGYLVDRVGRALLEGANQATWGAAVALLVLFAGLFASVLSGAMRGALAMAHSSSKMCFCTAFHSAPPNSAGQFGASQP